MQTNKQLKKIFFKEKNMSGVVVHTFDPCTRETEARQISVSLRLVCLQSEFQARQSYTMKPWLKTINKTTTNPPHKTEKPEEVTRADCTKPGKGGGFLAAARHGR